MPPDAPSPCETLPGVVTPRTRVRVLLPLPLAGAYDYAVPDDFAVQPGDFVVAPLGRNSFAGVVWDGEPGGSGDRAGEKTVDDSKLRELEGVLDVPAMPAAMRKFVDWVSHYTLSPPGAVLRMAMSVSTALDPPAAVMAYRRNEPGVAALAARQLNPGRTRVLALLAHGQAMMP